MNEPKLVEPTALRKVLVSEELFVQLGADLVVWGEPDGEGFYTPTLYYEQSKGRRLGRPHAGSSYVTR